MTASTNRTVQKGSEGRFSVKFTLDNGFLYCNESNEIIDNHKEESSTYGTALLKSKVGFRLKQELAHFAQGKNISLCSILF